jgi:hypothetical protein
VIRTFIARVPEGDPVTNDSATSPSTPDAVDIVTAPAGDARLNEDPIGANVGPLPPIDAVRGGPSNENGPIDGLPGRYESQDEEDAAAGLDMTRALLGASNG